MRNKKQQTSIQILQQAITQVKAKAKAKEAVYI
jgi:hypothetical protein